MSTPQTNNGKPIPRIVKRKDLTRRPMFEAPRPEILPITPRYTGAAVPSASALPQPAMSVTDQATRVKDSWSEFVRQREVLRAQRREDMKFDEEFLKDVKYQAMVRSREHVIASNNIQACVVLSSSNWSTFQELFSQDSRTAAGMLDPRWAVAQPREIELPENLDFEDYEDDDGVDDPDDALRGKYRLLSHKNVSSGQPLSSSSCCTGLSDTDPTMRVHGQQFELGSADMRSPLFDAIAHGLISEEVARNIHFSVDPTLAAQLALAEAERLAAERRNKSAPAPCKPTSNSHELASIFNAMESNHIVTVDVARPCMSIEDFFESYVTHLSPSNVLRRSKAMPRPAVSYTSKHWNVKKGILEAILNGNFDLGHVASLHCQLEHAMNQLRSTQSMLERRNVDVTRERARSEAFARKHDALVLSTRTQHDDVISLMARLRELMMEADAEQAKVWHEAVATENYEYLNAHRRRDVGPNAPLEQAMPPDRYTSVVTELERMIKRARDDFRIFGGNQNGDDDDDVEAYLDSRLVHKELLTKLQQRVDRSRRQRQLRCKMESMERLAMEGHDCMSAAENAFSLGDDVTIRIRHILKMLNSQGLREIVVDAAAHPLHLDTLVTSPAVDFVCPSCGLQFDPSRPASDYPQLRRSKKSKKKAASSSRPGNSSSNAVVGTSKTGVLNKQNSSGQANSAYNKNLNPNASASDDPDDADDSVSDSDNDDEDAMGQILQQSVEQLCHAKEELRTRMAEIDALEHNLTKAHNENHEITEKLRTATEALQAMSTEHDDTKARLEVASTELQLYTDNVPIEYHQIRGLYPEDEHPTIAQLLRRCMSFEVRVRQLSGVAMPTFEDTGIQCDYDEDHGIMTVKRRTAPMGSKKDKTGTPSSDALGGTNLSIPYLGGTYGFDAREAPTSPHWDAMRQRLMEGTNSSTAQGDTGDDERRVRHHKEHRHRRHRRRRHRRADDDGSGYNTDSAQSSPRDPAGTGRRRRSRGHSIDSRATDDMVSPRSDRFGGTTASTGTTKSSKKQGRRRVEELYHMAPKGQKKEVSSPPPFRAGVAAESKFIGGLGPNVQHEAKFTPRRDSKSPRPADLRSPSAAAKRSTGAGAGGAARRGGRRRRYSSSSSYTSSTSSSSSASSSSRKEKSIGISIHTRYLFSFILHKDLLDVVPEAETFARRDILDAEHDAFAQLESMGRRHHNFLKLLRRAQERRARSFGLKFEGPGQCVTCDLGTAMTPRPFVITTPVDSGELTSAQHDGYAIRKLGETHDRLCGNDDIVIWAGNTFLKGKGAGRSSPSGGAAAGRSAVAKYVTKSDDETEKRTSERLPKLEDRMLRRGDEKISTSSSAFRTKLRHVMSLGRAAIASQALDVDGNGHGDGTAGRPLYGSEAVTAALLGEKPTDESRKAETPTPRLSRQQEGDDNDAYGYSTHRSKGVFTPDPVLKKSGSSSSVKISLDTTTNSSPSNHRKAAALVQVTKVSLHPEHSKRKAKAKKGGSTDLRKKTVTLLEDILSAPKASTLDLEGVAAGSTSLEATMRSSHSETDTDTEAHALLSKSKKKTTKKTYVNPVEGAERMFLNAPGPTPSERRLQAAGVKGPVSPRVSPTTSPYDK
eukprot:PhM_4_TR5920/c0_g1_i1/m.11466